MYDPLNLPSMVAFSGIVLENVLYPNEEKQEKRGSQSFKEISGENEMRRVKGNSWTAAVH